MLQALLPRVLLPWATSQPTNEAELVERCALAARAAATALPGSGLQLHSQQQQQQHIDLLLRIHSMSATLPDIIKVMDQLLALLRRQSSSSSSSRSKGPQTHLPLDEIHGISWLLSGTTSLLAQMLRPVPIVEPFTWYQQPRAEQTADGSTGLAQHPWQSQSAKLTAALESLVRLPSAIELLNRGDMSHFLLLAGLWAVGDAAEPDALAATAIAAGFGSTEQRRLFSLLCSLLKRSGMLTHMQQTVAENCRLVAASAAARLAQLYALHGTVPTTAAAAPAAAGSGISDLLPWLVLFGRCCLQWAVQLQWRHQGTAGLPDAAAVQQMQPKEHTFMCNLSINTTSDVFFVATSSTPHAHTQPLLSLFLTALQAPLQDAGISAQISAAAGVEAGTLLAKINAAAAAVAAGHADKAADVKAAVKHLGQALTSLPCSSACNNPLCTNIACSSELQLVRGSQHMCSGCRTARNCGRECQVQHWKQHRPVCRALVAATEAAIATAAAATATAAASAGTAAAAAVDAS
jgi:hypothetical protein